MATNYFRMDGWVKSAQGPAVPGAQIYICTQPANTTALPPTPLAAVFSDVNGLVPITQPILTDGFGHYDFYAQAGVYTIIVGLGGVIQQVYPDQSVGGASGTTGGGGGTALVLQVNGTPTADQLLQNLQGGGSTTVTADGVGNVTISSIATKFGTAGQGYFYGAQSHPLVYADGGIDPTSQQTNNQVVVLELVLEAQYTISSMQAYCVTATGSSDTWTAGIYSFDGNTLLVSAGIAAFTTLTSQRAFNIILATPVTLPSGTYKFAFGGTRNSANLGSWSGFTNTSFYQGLVNQGGRVKYGLAANLMSGGALPATLGVVTAAPVSPQAVPLVMFSV